MVLGSQVRTIDVRLGANFDRISWGGDMSRNVYSDSNFPIFNSLCESEEEEIAV